MDGAGQYGLSEDWSGQEQDRENGQALHGDAHSRRLLRTPAPTGEKSQACVDGTAISEWRKDIQAIDEKSMNEREGLPPLVTRSGRLEWSLEVKRTRRRVAPRRGHPFHLRYCGYSASS